MNKWEQAKWYISILDSSKEKIEVILLQFEAYFTLIGSNFSNFYYHLGDQKGQKLLQITIELLKIVNDFDSSKPLQSPPIGTLAPICPPLQDDTQFSMGFYVK